MKLLLALLFISLSVHAKPFAAVTKILKGPPNFYSPVPDGKGNFAIGRLNGDVELYDHDGNLKKKIFTVKSYSLPFYFKNGDMAFSEGGTLYFLYNSLTQQNKVPAETYINGQALVLKNNLLAFPQKDSLKFYTSKGDIKSELKLENPWSLTEDPKGNLVIYNYKELLFLNPDLSIKTRLPETAGYPSVFTTDGILLLLRLHQGIDLIDQSGKIQGQFKTKETISEIIALPNGKAAVMCLDGYLYFIDSKGNKVGTHFHDSKAVWPLIAVNDNVLAYTNKMQLVFIDLNGKELGALTIPEKKLRTHALYRIDDQHLILHEDGNFHLVKIL